jgi:hypothetical protein
MNGDSDPGQRPAALWPYLLACALAACWLDFAGAHRTHSSDSLIPVLVSLYRWTPFYWGQNRLGMLLPLVALPFRHPVANLLVQTGLSAFAGLAAIFLLARYAFRGPAWPVVGLVAAAALLVLMPVHIRWDYLGTSQPYGLSLALGLGGLLLAESPPGGVVPRWRLAGALVLLLLAHWVNVALVVVLGPLVLFRPLLAGWLSLRPFRHALREHRALPLLALGYAGGALVAWAAPHHNPDQTAGLAARHWPLLWSTFARNGWEWLGEDCRRALGLALAGGLLPWCIPAVRRHVPAAVRAACPLLLAALAYFLFLGTRQWMLLNICSPRYLLPPLLLVLVALATLLVGPLRACAAGQAAGLVPAVFYRTVGMNPAARMAAPVLVAAAAWSYGLPSLRGVRADLDRTLGDYTDAMLRTGCTHVGGDYWKVWTTVFHTNLVLYEQGRHDLRWGIAERCEDTRDLWSRTPWEKMLVGCLGEDNYTPCAMRTYLSPLRPVPTGGRPFTSVWRLPPLAVRWGDGFDAFLDIEPFPGRLCGPAGELWLMNGTGGPRRITLSMDLRTGWEDGPSRVRLESAWFTEQVTVGKDWGTLAASFTLPPGNHPVRFSSDGPPRRVYGYEGKACFQVLNFQLKDAGPAPDATPEASPTASQPGP